jgi:hypothetical protein
MAKRKEQKSRTGTKKQQATSTVSTAVETMPQPSTTNPAKEQTQQSTAHYPLVADRIRRRQFLIAGTGLAATAVTLGGWFWAQQPHNSSSTPHAVIGSDQLVVYWNEATLQVIATVQPPLPVAARALAVVHTCMFDAWAAYDSVAAGTQSGTRLRRPADEHTLANKCQAASYAAYRALMDLFPDEQERFSQFMRRLKYDPANSSTNTTTPAGIGNVAAQIVLNFRHRDGSNQLGDLSPNPYSDYTKYQAANTVDTLKNPALWQPLRLPAGRVGMKDQQFACAQWADVTPFALVSASQFVPTTGPAHPSDSLYTQQAQQILQYSANLTDEQKIIAEYWSSGPNQENIVAHWSRLAQFISQRDHHTLDQNIKLFFLLSNAVLDASIACWASKRAYNSAYPITAIHSLFKGQQVRGWAGPGKDTQMLSGEYWLPYQQLAAIAPAFPEYCSEQSAFSAAAAEILRHVTGSDRLETSYTWPARTSQIEPTVPAGNLTLSWPTFSHAANQAGLAGRYGGIHFTRSDLDGRVLGSQVGEQVWLKGQDYIHGSRIV